MKLQIADTLSFPIDVVTQTLANIGRKGAGKTYLAQMVAEQMLDAGAQVVALDAVGNWYGLRIGADGKSKGKDIFVIGGDHGDVPLVPEAGARIARLLVEKQISVVLDISGFRIGERKRFAADFAEEFFHLKKSQRSPVHVFIEEAQLFVPQRIDSSDARMYGAFEVVVRIGRNYGIGCTLISQRPQSVNKEVLSQVECLCVLQVNGTHERKALEEWVQEAGADRKLVGELPGMKQGEGYVWSPSWLRVYQRVHFSKKTTFDASATPEVGKTVRAAKLSAVDVESLRESMQEVIAEAEKDDPKALRKQIVELTKQLGKEKSEKSVERIDKEKLHEVVMAEVQQIVQNVIRKAVVTRVGGNLDVIIGDYESHLAMIKKNRAQLDDDSAWKLHFLSPECDKSLLSIVTTSPEMSKTPRFLSPPKLPEFTKQAVVRAESNGKLKSGAERMLAALVQWYPESMTEGQMRSHAGMKKSGTFSTYMSHLRSGGYIGIDKNGMLRATEVGVNYFGEFPPSSPSSTEEVLAVWEPKLKEGARRILRELVRRNVKTPLDELAENVGMVRSGTFSTYLSHLRTARLIETGNGHAWANKEVLFL